MEWILVPTFAWLFHSSTLWFTVPALIGTLYFVFSLVFGEILDGDIGEASADGGLSGAPSAEFNVLSTQTLAALLMGGGWSGLGAYHMLDMSMAGAALFAVAMGFGYAYLVYRLLRAVARIQGSGNISLADTIGLHGDVYIEIPGENAGVGRVAVVVKGRRREYNARSDSPEAIHTRARVRVTGADEASNTLSVIKE